MNFLKRLALTASYVSSFPCLAKVETEAELSGLAKYLPTVGIIIGACLYWFCYFAVAFRQAKQLALSF